MSAQFGTILIIGATSGIGEAFARRYYADGKSIVATGRRLERLQILGRELPGLRTQQVSTYIAHSFPMTGHCIEYSLL